VSELDGTDGRGLGSPGARVAQAVERWGEGDVVRGCGRLLGLRTAPAGDDAELAMVLGGVSDPTWLAGGKPPGHAYWARVWAARALLYVWDAVAAEAIVTALEDPQWRVREMATKVITRREVPAADDMVGLVDDPSWRVRVAAARSLAAVGEGEHSPALETMAEDTDGRVARAAATALDNLARRLDRPL